MADSQDMFDAIVMADERFHGEGYQEGYEEGSSLGMIEGRQYGTLHGAKIGSEIGCYQGFALVWKCLLRSCASEKDSRKMKVLESLIGMIQKFPYDDPTYNKLHEDLDKIRGKFKQVVTLRHPLLAGWLSYSKPGGRDSTDHRACGLKPRTQGHLAKPGLDVHQPLGGNGHVEDFFTFVFCFLLETCRLHVCAGKRRGVSTKAQTQTARRPETLTDFRITGQTLLCSVDLPLAFGLLAHTVLKTSALTHHRGHTVPQGPCLVQT
ncbi:Oral cancer-overexpressed protein 1 [Fukomys damarensis]|uniref:Oral cancer-overexpressed protein 1 n=2 Tax=Fukomys damarensis TaxID=885580 RepID=A0A091D866_FUKDA|nr:Oral cancer-overexpressed protein 1 [Fukomys damarensis]